MTTAQARFAIRNVHSSFSAVVEAAAVLARSADTTAEDLLACLDHGGLPAEFAAIELYRRTNRPMPESLSAINLRREEWERVLALHWDRASEVLIEDSALNEATKANRNPKP